MATKKKVERGGLFLQGRGGDVEVRPANGKKFTMEEIQAAVGGYFELIVPAMRHRVVYANESGAVAPGFEENRHTPRFANMTVYALNGYGPSWRVRGDVLEVRKVDADEPVPAGIPTLEQLGRKVAA
jgi:hypothetical protein